MNISTLKPYVLVVTPDRDYLIAVKETLEKFLAWLTPLLAENLDEALSHMHVLTGPAIFLIDYSMPDMWGDEFIAFAKKHTRFEDECVLLTSGYDAALVKKAFDVDAVHFPKSLSSEGKPYNLGLDFVALIKSLERRLKHKERPTDALTGAYTLAGGLELWNHDFAKIKRSRRASFACIYVDVNYLKYVNDNYGHEAGNMYLRETVAFLKSLLDDQDYIIRIGGDEFLIILPGKSRAAATALKSQIEIRSKEVFISLERARFSISLALGVSGVRPLASDDANSTWKKMVEPADERMYEHKEIVKQSEPPPTMLLEGGRNKSEDK